MLVGATLAASVAGSVASTGAAIGSATAQATGASAVQAAASSNPLEYAADTLLRSENGPSGEAPAANASEEIVRILAASASHWSIGRMVPKCRTGTASPSTWPVAACLHSSGDRCATT